MADFRGYVTAAGQTFEALAKQMGYPVTIGFIEVGDGKLPDSESPIDRTQLVHKLKQFPAIVEQDSKNPGQWVATCYIPADDAIDDAGYFIREIGCKLINQGNGVLYAYRRVSDDWKPVITSGEAKSFIYKLRFIPSNGELLTPTIDPSVVLVDKEELDRVMKAHVESRNHPDANETEKGFSRHATQQEVNENKPSNPAVQPVVTVERLWDWSSSTLGKNISIFSLWKRAMSEAGYDLIGQFGTNNTIETAKQVLLSKDGTKVYGWLGPLPKDVDSEETPEITGEIGSSQWLDQSGVTLRLKLAEEGSDGLIGRFKSVNQLKMSAKPVLGGRYSVLGHSAARDGGAGEWLAVDSATNPANGVSVVQSAILPSLCFAFMAAIGGVVNIAQVGAAPAGDITNILNNLHADPRVTKVQVSPPAATPYYTVTAPVAVKKDMEFINQPTLTFTDTAATLSIEAPAKLENFKVYCNNTTAWSNKAIQVKSSDVTLNKFTVENAVEVPYGKFATGVYIASGARLYNINIDTCNFRLMRTAIDANDAEGLKITNLTAYKYVTAVYLKDVKHSRFKNAYMYGQSSVLTGRPGENGVLVEATIDNGCTDVEVEGYWVQETGEHGFRLGGQKTISDFKFKSCTSFLTGQAWKVGNTAAGEWHGGCGFKVLGSTDMFGHVHKQISLIDCLAIDCSDNYGTFPVGHGVNNFSSFLVMVADGVTMENCSSLKRTNKIASGSHGLLIGAISNLRVRGGNLSDSYRNTLKLFDEGEESGGIASKMGISNVDIDTSGVMNKNNPVISLASNKNPVSDVLINIKARGSSTLLRTEALGDTVYSNVLVTGKYTPDMESDVPVIWGQIVAVVNITAPWKGAYSPAAMNGSSILDQATGDFKYKKAGAWLTR